MTLRSSGPSEVGESQKIRLMEFYAHKYPGRVFFDRERGELVAVAHIPPHTVTRYDMRRVEVEVLEPLRRRMPELFTPRKSRALMDYIRPLLRRYRVYRAHMPAAEPGDVLISVRGEGLWENITEVEFYPPFSQSSRGD